MASNVGYMYLTGLENTSKSVMYQCTARTDTSSPSSSTTLLISVPTNGEARTLTAADSVSKS